MADALIRKIVHRIDLAVKLAEERLALSEEHWRRDCYRTVVTNLVQTKQALLDGKMPPAGDGAGWGAGKALSEWGLDDDELCQAVEAAEGLYRNER